MGCCALIPRITRARAWALYLPMLGAFVAANQHPLLNYIFTVILIVCFNAFGCLLRRRGPQAPQETQDVEALLSRAPGAPPAPAAASRVAYLDAVKALLAVVVVLHHVVGAFAGGGSLGFSVGNFRNALQPVFGAVQCVASPLFARQPQFRRGLPIHSAPPPPPAAHRTLNQAYFMSLFFFISAYFAPGSVARKGAEGFMRDRATRLALPFAPFFFLLGPALLFYVQWAMGTGTWAYIPYAGPLWFVVWLGVFSFFYAMVAEAGGPASFAACELPGAGALLGLGLGLGALQGAQMVGFSLFPLMPISWGSLPFDVCFFYAGVIAKRNGWLDDPLPRRLVLAARAYAALFIAAVGAGFYCLHLYGGGAFLLSANACGAGADREGRLGAGAGIGVIMALATASGPYTFFMSVAVLDFARQAMDGRSPAPWLKFLSDHAYAAYIFHPVAVFPATGAFVALARAGGAPMAWTGGGADSVSCVAAGGGSQEPTLLAGFLAATAVSLLGTYFLVFLIRRIPGASSVL